MSSALRVTATVLVCLGFGISAVLAEASPKLPKSAKKLRGAEITALFDGATISWKNFKINATGVAKYDLKAGTSTGTFTIGGKTVPQTGKASVKKDQLCFTSDPSPKEFCRTIYTNGADIYEVNGKDVASLDQKQ